MFRRPLIWALALVLLGEIVVFLLGFPLYKSTSLDEAMSGDSLEVLIGGTIEKITVTDSYSRLTIVSCEVFRENDAAVLPASGDGLENSEDKIDSLEADAETTALETHGIFVYADDLSAYEVGMRISVTGTLTAFDKPDNYGEFNKWLYYRTIGVDYMISADDIDIIGWGGEICNSNGKVLADSDASSEGSSFRWKIKSALANISNKISKSIDSISSSEEEAGIFKAMLLGDKSDLSDETYNSFKTCGIAHILAISGLHLSLLAEAVLKLLKKLYIPNQLAYALADGLLLLYVIMIDGHASAWRAFIMFTVSIIAKLVGRTYDLLSALGLAGILLLIMQPLYAVDGAFQLSFGAMAGIGIIFPRLKACAESFIKKLQKKYLRDGAHVKGMPGKTFAESKNKKIYFLKKLLDLDGFTFNKVISPLILSFSVQVMTMPVLAYHYFTISIYGIILNLIVIPLMSVALFSIISGSLVAFISNRIGMFALGSAHYIFAFITKLCEITKDLPASQIVIGKPAVWQIALYYALLAGILFISKKKKIFALGLIFIAVVLVHPRSSKLELTALYVGQGDCTVVAGSNGHAVIIDCGSTSKENVGENVVLPFLKASRITQIDAIFLSHVDEDHTNGVGDLLADSTIAVEKIVIPKATAGDEGWLDVTDLADDYGAEVYFMDSGEEYKNGDLELLALYPTSDLDSETIKSNVNATSQSVVGNQSNSDTAQKILGSLESSNDTSLVLLLKYKNFTALFPGDIGEEGESALVNSGTLTRVDYLKCPHHGSKYSSTEDFLSDILPKVTVISVGRKNRYGHPSDDAISRLENAYSKIFRTDTQGMITTEVDESGEAVVSVYRQQD